MVNHRVAVFDILGVDIHPLADAATEAGAGRVPGLPVRLAVSQVINAAQVRQLPERQGVIISQDQADFADVGGVDLYGELAGFQFVIDNAGAETLAQVIEKRIHVRILSYLLMVLTLVRLIFFCNCNTPNSRASAVGGQPGT